MSDLGGGYVVLLDGDTEVSDRVPVRLKVDVTPSQHGHGGAGLFIRGTDGRPVELRPRPGTSWVSTWRAVGPDGVVVWEQPVNIPDGSVTFTVEESDG
jgi:hypothetical protein